jgi:hypothetical protein
MTVIQIPLDKNPDVAALAADKNPGDRIYFCTTIKSNDPQTLAVRIEEATDDPADLPKPDAYDEEDGETDDSAEEEKGEADQSPEGKEAEAKPAEQPGSMGRKLAAKLMSGDSSF